MYPCDILVTRLRKDLTMNTENDQSGWGMILLRMVGEGGAIFIATLISVRTGDNPVLMANAPVAHVMILTGVFWFGYLFMFLSVLELPYSVFNMFAAVALIVFGALTTNCVIETKPVPDVVQNEDISSGKWAINLLYEENEEYQYASCKFTGSSKEANKLMDAMRSSLKEQKPDARVVGLSKELISESQ